LFVPSEDNPGFLHLLIRKEPDKPFVMQINHLNTIAGRIVKVAAETGD
jgi:hypothetical protein